MVTQKNLITLCFATVFALGLAACSSSDDGSTADAPTGTTPTGTTPTTPSAGSPVAASGDVMGAALQAAFGTILGMPGDSDTVEIPAGMEVVRAGVTFTCASEYPCTVTVTKQPRNHRRDVDELHARRRDGRCHGQRSACAGGYVRGVE